MEAAALAADGFARVDAWEKFELHCVFTHAPLTDPAKCGVCRHRACCNYEALRGYVGREKKCPVCAVPVLRTRNVERDDTMRHSLQGVPGAAAVWIRGTEMRTDDPSAAEIADASDSAGMPARGQSSDRSRRGAKRGSPDMTARRASKRPRPG